MLTDEEAALAKAEYDALPGTPPSGYSHAELAGLDRLAWVRETAAMWRAQGMQHMRVTIDGGLLWMEVWAERPRKEAPFDPPYTAARTGDR